MAKPKKKRDLRARLGKTITPKTKGGDKGTPAPPGGVAPPNLGGADPAPPSASAPAVTPPPAGVSAPPAAVAAPPASIGAAKSPGLAPPPFAAPAAETASAPDPFGAPVAAAPQEQVVRLEFDDKLIEDKEVGKAKRFTLIIVAGVCLAVGGVVGGFLGNTLETRELFEKTIQDAQTVYRAVDSASATVTAVQTHMNAIATSAGGNPQANELPAVNFEEIEALRALQKPIDANAVAGRNYNAFQPGVVHDLFTYLMNVQKIWDQIRAFVGATLPPARRTELTEAATSTIEQATTRYGALLKRAPVPEGQEGPGEIVAILALLSIEETPEGVQIIARQTRGGNGRAMQRWTGDLDDIGTSPSHLISVDAASARSVLGQQTNAFRDFLAQVRDLKVLTDQTVEIQGRLITAMAGAISEAGAVPGAGGETTTTDSAEAAE